MNLFDLNDDILEIVADEVFRWRKKTCGRELRWAWRRKRESRELLRSSYRQNIHEGRVMLTDNGQEAMNLALLSNSDKLSSKYFICGLRGFTTSDYNTWTRRYSYGISLRLGSSVCSVRLMIAICLNNGWEDFKEQTDATIVRYLMNKEQERKEY